MSAAAFAWLKEKPQGIYLKADEDPPYAGGRAEQLHWFQPSFCFFALEESELRICSLFISTAWRGETNLARWEVSHEINC